jgi:hypothetical protein
MLMAIAKITNFFNIFFYGSEIMGGQKGEKAAPTECATYNPCNYPTVRFYILPVAFIIQTAPNVQGYRRYLNRLIVKTTAFFMGFSTVPNNRIGE